MNENIPELSAPKNFNLNFLHSLSNKARSLIDENDISAITET